MKDAFVMRAFEKDAFGVVAPWRLPEPGQPPAVVVCGERRVTGIASAVKGAFTALSAVNAPFTASLMP
jgi:hypothetical protein